MSVPQTEREGVYEMTVTSEVKAVLRQNPTSARAYLNFRYAYAESIVQWAVADVEGDDAGREAATVQSHAAETAARALITGLMLDAQPGWDKWQASEAATDFTRLDFDAKALLYGVSSEPQRIFTSREEPDAYTLKIASHRVLGSAPGLTYYLFSEADAQIFETRTGQKLQHRHTL